MQEEGQNPPTTPDQQRTMVVFPDLDIEPKFNTIVIGEHSPANLLNEAIQVANHKPSKMANFVNKKAALFAVRMAILYLLNG